MSLGISKRNPNIMLIVLFLREIMLVVSCNCRGLGNPNIVETVKDLLRMDSTDILFLQETKSEEEALLSLSRTK